MTQHLSGPDSALERVRVQSFAADGRPLSIDSQGPHFRAESRYVYDGRGRLTGFRRKWGTEAYFAPHPSPMDRTASSSEWSAAYRYDAEGYLVEATRRDHDGSARTVRFRYSGGHLVRVEQAEDHWELSHADDCLSRAAHFNHEDDRPSMLHEYRCGDGGRVLEDRFTADSLAYPRNYTFTFDASGHLLSRHLVEDRDDIAPTPVLMQTLGYDVHHRLIEIEAGPANDGIESMRYRYDADGRLAAYTHGGNTARFRYGQGCSLGAVRTLEPLVPPELTAPWWFTGDEWKVLPWIVDAAGAAPPP